MLGKKEEKIRKPAIWSNKWHFEMLWQAALGYTLYDHKFRLFIVYQDHKKRF